MSRAILRLPVWASSDFTSPPHLPQHASRGTQSSPHPSPLAWQGPAVLLTSPRGSPGVGWGHYTTPEVEAGTCALAGWGACRKGQPQAAASSLQHEQPRHFTPSSTLYFEINSNKGCFIHRTIKACKTSDWWDSYSQTALIIIQDPGWCLL